MLKRGIVFLVPIDANTVPDQISGRRVIYIQNKRRFSGG